jgi:glucose/arabinose dehydrogenase
MSPRSLRWISTCFLSVSLALPAAAQQIRATHLVSFPDMPLAVTAPRGDAHRVFVCERDGRVRILRDGVLVTRAFLDISAEVTTVGEAGLLGLAFHPNYATNGRFFVSFVGRAISDPTLREYRVSSDPDVADPASGVVLFHNIPHQSMGHYASDLQFGPDGMLYYSLGDDGIADLPQNTASKFGKILRLDVDNPPTYVPADNPFAGAGNAGDDWVWAYGFRNPFRFSFDRLTGDMYIADVGSGEREEIDFQPRTSVGRGTPGYRGGLNYGWPCMEGTVCTGSQNCVCDFTGTQMVQPVLETSHNNQPAAMIAGFVYRGSAIPGMQGRFFYGDFNRNWIRTLVMQNGTATNIRDVSVELGFGTANGPNLVTSFGEDANGEIYFTTTVPAAVYRIDPVVRSCVAPIAYCEGARNSVGPGTLLRSTGSASIATPELALVADRAPPHVTGVFYTGTREVQVPLGNGWKCIAGPVRRFPAVTTDAQGSVSLSIAPASLQVAPGETREFQFYYRDSSVGAGFNLSDGLRVVFCP